MAISNPATLCCSLPTMEGITSRNLTNVKDGVKRLADSSDSLQDLIDPDDVFLQLPLAKGKKFCADSEQMTREDDEYCWVVTRSIEYRYGRSRASNQSSIRCTKSVLGRIPTTLSFSFCRGWV